MNLQEEPKQEQEIPICLELAYTDKNGNKFYKFRTGEMPYKRFISAKVQEHFISMGIDKDILSKIVDAGIRMTQQTVTDIEEFKSELNILWQNIKMRVSFVCSEDIYMRLASCYYVLLDEPLDSFTNAWHEKKLVMCYEDEGLRSFFLQTAFNLTTNLELTSEITIQNLLDYAKMREDQIPVSKLLT